jgi:hypothetical protein
LLSWNFDGLEGQAQVGRTSLHNANYQINP